MKCPTSLIYEIAVHKALNLTEKRYEKLKTAFNADFKAVWNAKPAEIAQILNNKEKEKFFRQKKQIIPERLAENLQKQGIKILFYEDKDFPLSLKYANPAPIILFILGDIIPTDFPALAVVGSRKIGSYGKAVMEKILPDVCNENITIISGLALGADAFAHRIALQNNTRTIAVLGNGIGHFYPAKNASLGLKILKENRGAIISEYFPETQPRPEHFPHRNRIVAALSKAVLVAEAATRSGSLITARLAVEMGKDVFAIPGDIFRSGSQGTNKLIMDGMATAIDSSVSLLECLGVKTTQNKQIRIKFPLTNQEKTILNAFGAESTAEMFTLTQKTGFSAAVLASQISLLEIKGLIQTCGIQKYRKIL